MARPPMPIGTWGKIRREKVEENKWRAHTWFRDADGVSRRVTATGTTGAKAESALKTKLTERSAPTGETITAHTRISALWDYWLERVTGEGELSESTIDGYTKVYNRDIKKQLGALTIRELTPGKVDGYIKELSKKYSTKPRHVKVVLRKMLDVAVSLEAIDSNPVAGARRVKKVKNEVVVMDILQLAALRGAIRAWMTKKRPGPKATNDLADVIDLDIATGSRIGETLAFLWEDLDTTQEPARLSVTGTIVTITGKGTFRKPKPKTEAGYRTVLLPAFATQMLLRRKAEAGGNPTGLIFHTRKGTPLAPNNVRRSLRRVRSEVGLDWVTPHVLRKTVSTLINDEVGLDAAQAQLGHVPGSKVTQEHYLAKPKEAPDVTEVLEVFAPTEPAQPADDAGDGGADGAEDIPA